MSNTHGHNPNDPRDVAEVLAAEFDALRPDGDYAGTTDADSLNQKAQTEEQPFTALCISGGGIRSATFSLGVLQALARRGIIDKFDYLSTVSGGGYIGGWLTAWAQRAGGLKKILGQLQPDAKSPPEGQPDPVAHLRAYNNYLSPKLGVGSGDPWTLAAIGLRNMLMNWAILIPLLMAVLLVPRLLLSVSTLPELLYGDIIFAAGSERLNYRAPELNSISDSWLINPGLPLLYLGLLGYALYNALCWLPGVGNENNSRYQYVSRILLPLVYATFAYLLFESLYFLGNNCNPSGDYWAGDNCEGPSNLFKHIALSFVPFVLALFAFSRHNPAAAHKSYPFWPLFLAVLAMALGAGGGVWVIVNFLFPYFNWPELITFAPPMLLLTFVAGTNYFVGMTSRVLGEPAREWMSRGAADILMFSAAWTVFCTATLLAPTWAIEWRDWAPPALAGIAVVSGYVSAFMPKLQARDDSSREPAQGWRQKLVSTLASAAPAVFIFVLAIGLSLLTNALLVLAHELPGMANITETWFAPTILTVDNPDIPGIYHAEVAWSDHATLLVRTSPGLLIVAGLLLVVMARVTARFVNINTFSLNGMYRHRLVRAYLGASNGDRQPNPFTGLDPDDDVQLRDLDPSLKPLHIVNMTLNLADTSRLDWQQRKGQSFTASALHCGSRGLGYRPTESYGGPRGLSLGSVMSVSGAAASPNMGYRTTGAAAFIMTLLNARLGVWLGNPGRAGNSTWRQASPHRALGGLIKEAMGRTEEKSAYVYLSDGGHFENLGLYEMVLRRCRRIVVIDSGCDPDFAFEDLGNAIRKIRIDFKLPIHFHHDAFERMRNHEVRCAVATICYSAIDPGAQDGELLYIKPMLTGQEAADVLHYSLTHPSFPHEDTADQWFDEAQTESYRMLGARTIDNISHGFEGDSVESFIEYVMKHYLGRNEFPDGQPPAQNPTSPTNPPPTSPGTPPAAVTRQPAQNPDKAVEPAEGAPAEWTPLDVLKKRSADNQGPIASDFDILKMYPSTLKGRIISKVLDEPQWWMAIVRRLWPVVQIKDFAMILRHDHVNEAFAEQAVFQTPFGERMREMTDGWDFILGMQDGPDFKLAHEQIAYAFKDFKQDVVDEVITPFCKQKAEEIVAESGGRFDAIQDLIARVPMQVVEQYYGVPIPNYRDFWERGIAMSGYMFGPPGPRPANADMAVAASKGFTPLIDGAIAAAKTGAPYPDNVVGRFAELQAKDPEKLADGQIRGHLYGMIEGFVPTNTIAAGNILEMLLRRDEFMRAAQDAAHADDDAYLNRVLFEASRWKPINPGPFRICVADYTLGEGTACRRTIKAGTRVLNSYASAMFDRTAIKDPYSFNPERDKSDYMGFGVGVHWCIGEYIARAQITQTLKPLLKKEGLRRVKGKSGKLVNRGPFPAHLWVEFNW